MRHSILKNIDDNKKDKSKYKRRQKNSDYIENISPVLRTGIFLCAGRNINDGFVLAFKTIRQAKTCASFVSTCRF